jgi:hypothetical protein
MDSSSSYFSKSPNEDDSIESLSQGRVRGRKAKKQRERGAMDVDKCQNGVGAQEDNLSFKHGKDNTFDRLRA